MVCTLQSDQLRMICQQMAMRGDGTGSVVDGSCRFVIRSGRGGPGGNLCMRVQD